MEENYERIIQPKKEIVRNKNILEYNYGKMKKVNME
jgi:hypothetical protein